MCDGITFGNYLSDIFAMLSVATLWCLCFKCLYEYVLTSSILVKVFKDWVLFITLQLKFRLVTVLFVKIIEWFYINIANGSKYFQCVWTVGRRFLCFSTSVTINHCCIPMLGSLWLGKSMYNCYSWSIGLCYKPLDD